MKLKRLIVKNFGVFRETHSFDIDGELIVIYGDNFSGKTTLVRAVYFALCGKAAAYGIPVKRLVTTDEESATAGIVYEHDDATYRIYRSTKGDFKSERFQRQIWQPLKDAGSILPKLNPHQWQMSCFLQEDELGNFLSKTSANRREILHSVLGIDSLLAAQENVIKVRRLAKREENAARSRQEHLYANAVDECAEALTACRAEVVRLENTLTGGEEHGGEQRLYAEWKQQHEIAQQHLQRLTSEYDGLLAGFANSEELANTLRTVTARLPERTSALHDVETFTEQRIALASKLRHLEELLANFQTLHADEVCPTCQQPLSNEHLQRLETTYQEQVERDSSSRGGT